jgi:hypothetical protein
VATFTSFLAFRGALHDLQTRIHPAAMAGMRAAAGVVLHEAQQEIGTYQSAAGPFPAWAQLAPSTVRERVALGFTPDEPLLRSGELRDSYEVDSQGDTVGVGSSLDRALYLEAGEPTRNVPPRSVLGRAFVVSEAKAFQALLATVQAVLRIP